jgi:hypothetical protein
MSAVLTSSGGTAVPPATLPAPAAGKAAGSEVVEPSAAERLARSREEMRSLMQEIKAPHERRPAAGPGVRAAAATVVDKLSALPGLGVVIDAARGWWANHPWRAVTLIAADAGRAAIAPVAQRHPVALVAGAALFGALALRWGPWRWLVTPAMFAGFLPRLLTRAAASIPAESWISGLTAFSRTPTIPAKPDTARPRT